MTTPACGKSRYYRLLAKCFGSVRALSRISQPRVSQPGLTDVCAVPRQEEYGDLARAEVARVYEEICPGQGGPI
jgi:hypothetical protein